MLLPNPLGAKPCCLHWELWVGRWVHELLLKDTIRVRLEIVAKVHLWGEGLIGWDVPSYTTVLNRDYIVPPIITPIKDC